MSLFAVSEHRFYQWAVGLWFCNSLYAILSVWIVIQFLFLSVYISFKLIFQLLVSTSRAGRILIYSYQLQYSLPGLFGIQSGKGPPSTMWFNCTAIRGWNDVRFFNQYPCSPSFAGATQLVIFLFCIFTISSQPSPYCLHSQIVFYSLSTTQCVGYVLPDVIPKFDTIFRIWDNSITLFFCVQFFAHLLLVDLQYLILSKFAQIVT